MSLHELNNMMLYIHPPLAIASHVFIFLFAFSLFFIRNKEERKVRWLGNTAWLLAFLGLVTGIIWAQIAWGSYWSWDPKETLTLLLFISFSSALTFYYEKKWRLSKLLSLTSCVLVLITASSSFIIAGLHTFL